MGSSEGYAAAFLAAASTSLAGCLLAWFLGFDDGLRSWLLGVARSARSAAPALARS
jgi:hypothetical protein